MHLLRPQKFPLTRATTCGVIPELGSGSVSSWLSPPWFWWPTPCPEPTGDPILAGSYGGDYWHERSESLGDPNRRGSFRGERGPLLILG